MSDHLILAHGRRRFTPYNAGDRVRDLKENSRPIPQGQWKPIGPHGGWMYATIGGLQLFVASSAFRGLPVYAGPGKMWGFRRRCKDRGGLTPTPSQRTEP